MNNATKNKLTSGTDQGELTSGNACWETPPLIFQKLSEDFGPFDVDLTADAERHLCQIWFGPDSPVDEFDALTADWMSHGRTGYSNPPYGRFIQKILKRARFWRGQGFASTLLLPLRVTAAFKEHVLDGGAELFFCDKRITFFEDGVPRLNEEKMRTPRKDGGPRKPSGDGAVFDSIVVRFDPRIRNTNVGLWKVPKHVTADDLARAVARRSTAQAPSLSLDAVDPHAAI